jgi:hypothetical protein
MRASCLTEGSFGSSSQPRDESFMPDYLLRVFSTFLYAREPELERAFRRISSAPADLLNFGLGVLPDGVDPGLLSSCFGSSAESSIDFDFHGIWGKMGKKRLRDVPAISLIVRHSGR